MGASVRGSGEDLLELLRGACSTGVPQNVEYLIKDAGRVNVRARMLPISAVVEVSGDAAHLLERPAIKALDLQELAPGLYGSTHSRSEVGAALAGSGGVAAPQDAGASPLPMAVDPVSLAERAREALTLQRVGREPVSLTDVLRGAADRRAVIDLEIADAAGRQTTGAYRVTEVGAGTVTVKNLEGITATHPVSRVTLGATARTYAQEELAAVEDGQHQPEQGKGEV